MALLPSSSTALLPLEQIILPSTNENINYEDILDNMLDDVEHEQNLNVNIGSPLFSPHDFEIFGFENNANINLQLEESISQLSTNFLELQNRLKRRASNPLYITDSLNQSLFNESPITKRAKTPLFNSPTSCQSPIETRVPSPLPIPQQLDHYLLNKSISTFEEVDSYPPISLQLQTNPNFDPNIKFDDINDLDELNPFDDFVDTDMFINDTQNDHQLIQCNFNMPTSCAELNIQPLSDGQMLGDGNLSRSGSNIIELPIEVGDHNKDVEPSNANNQESDVYVLTNYDETNAPQLVPIEVDDHYKNVEPSNDNNHESNVYVLTYDETNAPQLVPGPVNVINNVDENIRENENGYNCNLELFMNEDTNVNENIENDIDLESFLGLMNENVDNNENIQEPPTFFEEPPTSPNELSNFLKDAPDGITFLSDKGWMVILERPYKESINISMDLGRYKTLEIATRVRDLAALKLNFHLNNKNFEFTFPISDYYEELREMKNWSEEDYIWSLKRHSLAFKNQTGFNGVYVQKDTKKGGKRWEGKLIIHGTKFWLGSHNKIEIPAIFWDLVVMFYKKNDVITNFRPGHYTEEDTNKFMELLKREKIYDATEWDLIKRIMQEPPFFSKYVVENSTSNQNLNQPSFLNLNKPVNQILDQILGRTSNQTSNQPLNQPLFSNVNDIAQSEKPFLPLESQPLLPDVIDIAQSKKPLLPLESQQIMDSQKMAKHFMECPRNKLEESWKLYRKHVDESDELFEKTILEEFGVLVWSPTWAINNLIKANIFLKENLKVNDFFPCLIATTLSPIDIQRRIFGFKFSQHINDQFEEKELQILLKKLGPSKLSDSTSHDPYIKNHQKKWISLPNIRYLPSEFNDIIACDSGLIVVKGGKQPQELSNQTNLVSALLAPYDHYWMSNDYLEAKNQSIIIVTNPLTYEIKPLPPMPHLILHEKVAEFNFDDSTKTSYRLIVVGVHKSISESNQNLENTYVGLGVYCSINNSWMHFGCIQNASLLSKDLGSSTIVVHGCFVYCGGTKIDSTSKKKGLLRPSIFHFNISKIGKPPIIIDFTKGGDMYFIKSVEPPRLVQVEINTKLYAVSREARVYPMILFVIEVIVDKEGVPTGLYKSIKNGIMPEDIFSLLFKRPCNFLGDKSHVRKKLTNQAPWEVIGSHGYIAIKVLGFDPAIALYNVQKDEWKYIFFPYNKHIPKPLNTANWKLISKFYEARWEATP